MADQYTIVTQYPDVETDGGQVARDVTVVGTQTKPHGVYFERRYPKKTFKLDTAKSDSLGFSIMFETLFDFGGVEAVTWGQRLNTANQLEDIVTVYFTSPSGESSDFLVVPFAQFAPELIGPQIADARTQLAEAEAS